MLFCEPTYFLFLLPITVIVYWFFIHRRWFQLVVPILIVASVIFYVTWSWKFFLLLFASASFNFLVGRKLLNSIKGKFWLYLGVLSNLTLLGYFKYFNFFIEICNNFSRGDIGKSHKLFCH